MTRAGLLVCSLVASMAAAAAAQPGGLTVVGSGPTGEVAALTEAGEVRVVFSEAMVAVGRIPQPVQAPFFRIEPALPGTFRWSGTTILIFTPDPRRPLPFATRFDVTIDASAKALSGRTLAAPHTFSFTTPTPRLLATNWYRRNRLYNEPLVVALRFNQPMRASDVLAHLSLRYRKHAWEKPSLPAAARERLRAIDPTAPERFDAKVAAAASAASAETAVPVALAGTWDKRTFKPSPDLVVVQTTVVPPPESWITLSLDRGLPSPAGPAKPAEAQTYTIELERTFFVDGPQCATACDPSAYNPIWLRQPVAAADLRKAISVTDLTAPSRARKVAPGASPGRAADGQDAMPAITLEEAGFDRQPPATTYAVAIDASLRAADGQVLGHTWLGTVENWHERAFTSFGDGHGVWETGGGLQLPFYSRNFTDVEQWAGPVAPGDLMPRVLELQRDRFVPVPPGAGLRRKLQPSPDKVQSFGLDLTNAVSPAGTGLVWAGIREGTPLARAGLLRDPNATRSTLVQVTNLGVTVKDSPHAILVFVTRLDTGAPVGGARVSVVDKKNQVYWTGATDGDGVATGPGVPLRDPRRFWDTGTAEFLVLAEKDGDVAYVGSNWYEGLSPWEFGARYDLLEAAPVLRGVVFTDRGVYRPGEEVHFKAVLRADTAAGIELVPAGTPVFLTLLDSRSKRVDRRAVQVSEWSSLEWTTTLPAEAALGTYAIAASLDDPDAPRPAPAAGADAPTGDEYEGEDERAWLRTVRGSFLVAAYRRPDFRVDVTLAGAPAVAGATLKGAVSARYLFGAPMKARPARWSYRRVPLFDPPRELTERFPDERFVFVGGRASRPDGTETVSSREATLTAGGELVLDLETSSAGDQPYLYTLEAEVEDVSRQRIANRGALTVHPAAFYIGVRRPPYFVDRRTGAETALVAVSPDGQVVPGVDVTVTLTQTQWHSVRRAEGSGFYTWETTRRDEQVGTWTATTAAEPVPLTVPLPSGGYFTLRAEATDGAGRRTATELSFYGTGDGYTAWQRYDHNRIDLVPERATYKPGDRARLMIQSPWEAATALVTTEREGVRTHRRFALTSTQQTVEVPITEQDIPNVYVSVLLVRGRTAAPGGGADDGSDPGKPSFRLGYAELKVDQAAKRLSVSVAANQDEYRPAARATVDVEVKDVRGRGAAGEVTLWAVDYGVLSLTAYQTPDVLGSVYVPKALQVLTTDNRQRIVSRRVLTPKGEDEGGGGGTEAGAGTLRKDFRALAFWLGSVVADAQGRARATVTLPESLTTYRIMAVAADKASRFGSAQSEIRVNKPVTLKAAFPRFLAVGDRAHFGAVVGSQLKDAGTALVTIRSLDPGVLRFTGETSRTADVGPGGTAEVRFDAVAASAGRARVQVSARLGSEGDAFEDTIPVSILAPPETVAAYGQTDGAAAERLEVPQGAAPAQGGLHVEASSTAMVGLGEGARYLVEYPYGCAEQRASRALALALAAELGEAFRLPGIEPARLSAAAQSAVTGLGTFQCPNGGFASWPGDCAWTSPYLTSYVLHVLRVASSLGHEIDREVQERAYAYLEERLAQPPPSNAGWWPHYTAWQAFAVRELVEGGRNQDSNLTRLYGYRDRMPVFALAYLADALAKRAETGPRVEDLARRLNNAVLPEGGSAHVEELNDPHLLWLWNSNVRSTAVVLGTLLRSGQADLARVRPMVRWLMDARRNGRWGNTQENAVAMEALVEYYKTFERQVPDFTGVITLGDGELLRHTFAGRSAGAVERQVPMSELASRVAPGAASQVTFRKEGTGTLFYSARLRYVVDRAVAEALDAGFAVERRYAAVDETGAADPPTTTFRAGDLVRVTLTLNLTKERRYVAVDDPVPAGFEPVDGSLSTTAAQVSDDSAEAPAEWGGWGERGGFDHVERRDDRVVLFAERLAAGTHQYSYLARATTAGAFRTAPAHAEEMYAPEVFGRTASVLVEIQR